jgi:hypothetical protein
MPAVAPSEASADVESDHAWTLLTTVGGDLDEESAVDALVPRRTRWMKPSVSWIPTSARCWRRCCATG